MCSGGLEDVRAACNATKGRLPSKVITLDSGKIQGFKDLDYKHTVFRGIPYAAPPTGDLRSVTGYQLVHQRNKGKTATRRFRVSN